MGANHIKSALDLEAGHVLKGASNETVAAKAAYINKLMASLEEHQSSDHKIMANESLSQQGKMDALRRLGTNDTAPALKWIRPEVTRLQEKKKRYERQFFTVDSGIEDLAERMPTFVYLWGKLDALDHNARIKRFYQAAETDQVMVMAALLSHPEGSQIDQEAKERALLQRAARLTPQDFDNYQQTLILLEFLTMARDWIARWLAEEVGVENAVIRTIFGDEVADALSGIPQFAGATK